MTNRKQITRTRKKTGIDSFFNTTDSSITVGNTRADRASFDSITDYYKLAGVVARNDVMIMGDCFAVRLANFIIETVTATSVGMTRRGHIPASFYRQCGELLANTDIESAVADNDLLIIYLKQMAAMLRTAGVIVRSGNRAVVADRPDSDEALFGRLFQAFWCDIPWARIFPSDQAAADALHESRNILKDILLRHHSRVRLDLVANDFFDLTGFSKPNDLFMISFLDFYYFTWLRHFGCICYLQSSLDAPVFIQVTNEGRKFLPAMA